MSCAVVSLTNSAEGRLHQPTIQLLQRSDVKFHRPERLDIALVKNHNLALVFLPAGDIPTFVGEGRVHLGITGRDQVAEHEAISPHTVSTGVEEVLALNFGRCKLQVQVPRNGNISRPDQLIGRNVVSSFTNLAHAYFAGLEAQQQAKEQEQGQPEIIEAGGLEVAAAREIQTKITYLGGSVEAACALGVADGIVDLVGK